MFSITRIGRLCETYKKGWTLKCLSGVSPSYNLFSCMQMFLSHNKLMDGISFPSNNLMILNTRVHLPQCEYKVNKVRMEIMNHWFHHLQADSSWKPNAFNIDSDWSFLTLCTCSERKSYLKVTLLKSRLVSANFLWQKGGSRSLNFIFIRIYTYYYGGTEWKTRGDFIFNNWIVHWASCFIPVQVGEWKLYLSTTKGGVIFKCLFPFKEQLSTFLHYLLKLM